MRVVKVNLTPDFELDVEEILKQAKNNVKVFFICSPNNPTGNIFRVKDIERLLREMNAIIVIDEAYINFSDKPSWTERLDEFPNLVVMQTLSKAWGMAGIRLGQGYSSKRIVEVLNKIKLPYNLNTLTQEAAIKALDNISEYKEKVGDHQKRARKVV
jgi:histidinol-phosphate aminotransferase